MSIQDPSPNWGGKRAGAGRRASLPAGTRNHAMRVTDEEFRAIKEFLKQLRAEAAEKQQLQQQGSPTA